MTTVEQSLASPMAMGSRLRGNDAKRLPRVDIHTHVAFPEILNMARAIKLRGNGPGKRDWVPASSQVVSMNLPTPCYWASAALVAKIARACNELMARFVSVVPERFVGIGVVPLQDPEGAVKELRYLVHELRLRGVQIPSNVRNHDLGEPAFRLFWAEAERLGVPVVVHPRGFTHDDRLHKFFLWNTVGQPLEEALAMASLIHEGILDAYPRLKIVICHGGGYLPFYSGRGDKAFESRPETREHITAKPSHYMRRLFYDSVIFDPNMLARLVHKVGADRIMMGSDYPRGEIETDPVGFVSTAGLSDQDRDKILSTNALALFGIGDVQGRT
jgi:aminocarboxymuconate-semialdehyde decarboxylase